MADKIKTKIAEIPVANKELYQEIAKLNRTTGSEVRGMIEFTGAYIADVIKKGTMENVMLPYFGKFRVKKKVLLAIKARQRAESSGKNMIWQALNGKRNLTDKRVNKPDDETI